MLAKPTINSVVSMIQKATEEALSRYDNEVDPAKKDQIAKDYFAAGAHLFNSGVTVSQLSQDVLSLLDLEKAAQTSSSISHPPKTETQTEAPGQTQPLLDIIF